MRVLIACEYSGRVREAFRRLGHDAISCDLLPSEDNSPHHHQCNVFDLIENMHGRGIGHFDLMIAHPPCTRLTNSGVRWLHIPPKGKTKEQMWHELEAACEFYQRLRNVPINKKAIENPIMHKYARQKITINSRQIVQPWWFGDKAFKATGFELIGLPELIATNKIATPKKGTKEYIEWSACHMASPGPNRWKERSRTYQGIADAMAAQWGNP